MALTIYENKESTGSKIKVGRRLYTDVGGNLVEDGDPRASMLFCSAGKSVSKAAFEAAGGVIENGEPVVKVVAEVAPEPEPEPEPKPKPTPKAKAKPKAKKRGK